MLLSPAFAESRSRKRPLRIALLISAVFQVAVLIWVRIDPPAAATPIAVPVIEITLIDRPPKRELESGLIAPTPASEVPQDVPEIPKDINVAPTIEPAIAEPPEPSDPIDWENIISTYAENAALQNLEQERLRDTMWQKTHSIMFTPPEDWLIEDKPYLPDLQFEADKPKRLGIRISENCYLGFPGIDPQTVDSDAPGWSGGGSTQPTVNLITCGFGG